VHCAVAVNALIEKLASALFPLLYHVLFATPFVNLDWMFVTAISTSEKILLVNSGPSTFSTAHFIPNKEIYGQIISLKIKNSSSTGKNFTAALLFLRRVV
jgi:hypothetical protein